MKVPLLDLKKQYETIKTEIREVTEEVCDSQWFIMGPRVEELEKQIAEYCNCRFGVGVSSGTDALLISLMSAGIGPGDTVMTTPYTFFATVGAIVRTGARPLFADIREDTFNLDPKILEMTLLSLSDEEKEKVKAIIPVHLYGQCADMEPILNLAEKFGLIVIEDAAQAIGAAYKRPESGVKRAGSMGLYGCFSFFPSKNLGAFGDGGMVTTSDPEVYDRLKKLRNHGASPKYYHAMIGGNFRLDALQAAILIVKLRYLDRWTEKRQENAALYRTLFEEEGLDEVLLPDEKEERHIYNQFVIRAPGKRDALKAFLNEKGVGSEIYYPVPLHMQTCFSSLGYKKEDFPVSVTAAETSLALPIFPELTSEQINYVVDMTAQFFSRGKNKII
jgi:dTDP-4-amino-4,6-dideoxygalactose transaminase